MRTMLISLILFCSLTQLAIAIPQPDGTAAKIEGCGTTYTCFVPEICTVGKETGVALADKKVTRIDNEENTNMLVNNDCQAIIRFHLYTTSWAYIIIESNQTIDAVNEIEFIHTGTASGVEVRTFSCKRENDTIIGKYGTAANMKVKYNGQPSTTNKLHCEFEVKLRAEQVLNLKNDGKDKMSFKVNTAETQKSRLNAITTSCDPSNFNFDSTQEDQKLIDKIQYSAHEPGKYTCTNPEYKIEFRKLGSAESRKVADTIECVEGEFKINGEVIAASTTIDIRCFTEVKFHCKYNVKAEERMTAVIGPDMNKNVESKLKCPPNNHLVIVKGTKKTIVMNPEFECSSSGGEPLWRVKDGPKKISLTKDGPPVYCTNDLNCNLIRAIPYSSVKNGNLDINGVPTCFEEGVLKTVEGKHVVTNARCDNSTGNFKYTADDREVDVVEGTKFFCEYPPIVDANAEKEQKDQMVNGSLGAVGGLIGVFVSGCLIAVLIVYCRKKMEHNRRLEENQAAWFKYCMNEVERAEYLEKNKNKANKKPKQVSSGTPDEPWNWNNMMMSFQYIFLNFGLTDPAGSLERPPMEDTLDYDKSLASGMSFNVNMQKKVTNAFIVSTEPQVIDAFEIPKINKAMHDKTDEQEKEEQEKAAKETKKTV